MAKTLYLMRHAKSNWADMRQSDFDRPLNQRGLRDAPEMGRRLKLRGVEVDSILCSPAQRARQTAELLTRELDTPMETVQFIDSIYEASTDVLLSLIRELPDSCTSAMIIGHNPSIGGLVQELSNRPIEEIPTCAIATIELNIDHWREISTCAAHLHDYDYPKRDATRLP